MDKFKKHLRPGCHETVPGGPVVCVDPPMCFPPAQWTNCTTVGPLRCDCAVVQPQVPSGPVCTAIITYHATNPTMPNLQPMESFCDPLAAALAFAALIQKCAGLMDCSAR